MSVVFDRGSAIVIEVEFKTQTPFVEDPVYVTPVSPVITIIDPDGTSVVTSAGLTSSGITGKWYYIVNTALSWITGRYESTVHSTYSIYQDTTEETDSFVLK